MVIRGFKAKRQSRLSIKGGRNFLRGDPIGEGGCAQGGEGGEIGTGLGKQIGGTKGALWGHNDGVWSQGAETTGANRVFPGEQRGPSGPTRWFCSSRRVLGAPHMIRADTPWGQPLANPTGGRP